MGKLTSIKTKEYWTGKIQRENVDLEWGKYKYTFPLYTEAGWKGTFRVYADNKKELKEKIKEERGLKEISGEAFF